MDNYTSYTTKQGDTWDIISLRLYNDEFKASLLMQVNSAYVDIIVFSAGVVLQVPIIEASIASTLPPWKR